MGDTRQDQVGHILEHIFDIFSLHWRFRRQGGADFSGLHLRKYRVLLDALIIIGDPIHHQATAAAELIRCHVVIIKV